MFANDPEMAKKWAAHTPDEKHLPDKKHESAWEALAEKLDEEEEQ